MAVSVIFPAISLVLFATVSNALFLPYPGMFPLGHGVFVIPHGAPECLVEIRRVDNDTVCISALLMNEIIQSTVLGGAAEDELPRPSKKVLDDRYVFMTANVISSLARELKRLFGFPAAILPTLLPLIDTSLTFIGRMCPPLYTPSFVRHCDFQARYRTINGVCNNLAFPHFGVRLGALKRILPSSFENGIDVPRGIDWDGFGKIPFPPVSRLPNPRKISTIINVDQGLADPVVSLLVMSFGQLLDHEVVAAVPTSDETVPDHGLACCGPNRRPHRDCFPVPIPEHDPFFSQHRHSCLSFARSAPALTYGCRMGPRESINGVTSYIDGSLLYGSSAERERNLREFRFGRLRVLDRFVEQNLKPLMPLNTVDPPDVDCIRPTESHWCFLGGDIRANEQTLLAVLHTLFVRLHNLWAEGLQTRNPHWDDERVYQETRRIVTAVLADIVYREFLPVFIGPRTMEFHGIKVLDQGFYDGYNPSVEGSATVAFSTAAFRAGHTLLPTKIERFSVKHEFIDAVDLSTHLFRPYDLWKPGYMDSYVAGLINQASGAFDPFITAEVTNHLFQPVSIPFGEDLVTRNIQRGRDHGMPGYTAYRALCGLSPVNSWDDMALVTTNRTAFLLSGLYQNVHDVDLWVGGVSEKHLEDAVVGPTFACIIARQFRDLRDGDRFWYENGGFAHSFTPEQLQEVRGHSMSALLCDTADHLIDIQRNPFLLADLTENPRFPCSNQAVFPRLNLDAWTERPVSFV